MLYVYEKRDVLSFPVMIWISMILWEVSSYARFIEQPYDDMEEYDIMNKKVYG
jgi:hypothetical protein